MSTGQGISSILTVRGTLRTGLPSGHLPNSRQGELIHIGWKQWTILEPSGWPRAHETQMLLSATTEPL